MAQSSKMKRHKLKAHDQGEDRHNKGLSLIKKQNRLESEHQSALQLAASRRHAAKEDQIQKLLRRNAEIAAQHRRQERRRQARAESQRQLTPQPDAPVKRAFRIVYVDPCNGASI